MGTRKQDGLARALEGQVPQLLVIGDAAQSPGNAVLATGTALDAALAV